MDNPLTQFAAKWHSMSPQQKQEWINTAGEMTGGTAGALAGSGWLSIPGAGAGATLGKLAGEYVGPWLGGSGVKKQSGGAEATDLAKTFGFNAATEGIGQAVPAAIRLLKPTAKAAKFTAILDRMGVPTGLPERAGSQFLQQLKGLLGHAPLAAGTVQNAERDAVQAWETSMGRTLNGIDPASVPREGLAAMAKQASDQAKQAFNSRVQQELDAVAHQIHPQPVTAQSAGQALKQGLVENKAGVRDWARDAYGALSKKADDMDVVADASNIEPKFREMWQNTDPAVRHFLPGDVQALAGNVSTLTPRYSRKTVRALNDIAGGMHADGLAGTFSTLTEGGQEAALRKAAEAGVDLNKYRYLDLDSLATLRSQMGKYIAKLDPNTQGTQLHYANQVMQSIDEAASTLPSEIADEWTRIRGGFHEGAKATRPPAGPNALGNNMAGKIGNQRGVTPEQLAHNLTGPRQATNVEGAELATTPFDITPDAGGDYVRTPTPGAARPLDQTARLAVQDLGQNSLKQEGRVSPGFVNQHLLTPGVEDTARPLMGDANLQSLRDVARPANLNEEAQLFDSPLSKAIDSPNGRADGVFDAMFPKKSPQAVTDANIGLLPNPNAARRSLAQDLVFGDGSRQAGGKAGKAMGDLTTPYTNSKSALDRMSAYGETVPNVLGQQKTGEVKEGLEALQYLQEPHLYTNTSNTGNMRHMTKAVGAALSVPAAMVAGSAMGQPLSRVGLYYGAVPAAAHLLTNPWLAKGLTSAASSSALPVVQAAGGALVRNGALAATMPNPKPQKLDTSDELPVKADTSDELPFDTSDELPFTQPPAKRR